LKSELAKMLTMAAILASIIHVVNAGTNIRDVCRNRPKIEFN